jgi:hypothetical protein
MRMDTNRRGNRHQYVYRAGAGDSVCDPAIARVKARKLFGELPFGQHRLRAFD